MLSKFRKRNKKGFTLIELMIVIAIIGILAAIAVPQFISYRLRSYNAAAKAIVHNLKADEGNLNAELGVYGHTETLPAALSVNDGGQNVADTNAQGGLKISAVGTNDGARLVGSTRSANIKTYAIGIALGANMIALAADTNDTNDDSAFNVFARHYKGDTAYGADGDVENILYSVSNPAWPNSTGLMATTAGCLPDLDHDDDIVGAGGAGAPTALWEAVR